MEENNNLPFAIKPFEHENHTQGEL